MVATKYQLLQNKDNILKSEDVMYIKLLLRESFIYITSSFFNILSLF